jgi:simple sugar transport system permease protein
MSTPITRHDPLMRIVKRGDGIVRWKAWAIRGIAVLVALLLSGLFIFSVTGLNPIKVYGAMFNGALGSSRKTWSTIRDTMLLLCIGVGLAPAFKMRFWNIGAEGQVLVGGVATAGLMIWLGKTASLPTPVMLLIMAAVSIVAGAVWGVIPALFKARWGTNETLFTLMLNYIAIQITSYCVALWENPFGSNTVGVINPQTEAGWFPRMFGNSYVLNIIIVMVLAVGMYIYLKYSKQGYEISVLGESERTARYAGIKPGKVIIRTMAISGAICGLAGFVAVAGADHTISTSTAGGRGFTAIIVAWLAQFNTFVMLLISLLLVFLQKGAVQIATDFKLNDFASNVITGIILFCIIASEFFINYRVIFRKRKEVDGK